MISKKKRTTDRELLDLYYEIACVVCGSMGTTVAHHVITKGAGGPDELWNLIPLCHTHHHEVHRVGRDTFFGKYDRAYAWLLHYGWTRDKKSGAVAPPSERWPLT